MIDSGDFFSFSYSFSYYNVKHFSYSFSFREIFHLMEQPHLTMLTITQIYQAYTLTIKGQLIMKVHGWHSPFNLCLLMCEIQQVQE